MATKAERFKAEAMRAARAKHPRRASKASAGKRAALRGRRKDRLPNPTSHNEAARARKTGLYEIEYDATARPPRKSTRISKAHVKTDAPLRITTMAQVSSPPARAGLRNRAR